MPSPELALSWSYSRARAAAAMARTRWASSAQPVPTYCQWPTTRVVSSSSSARRSASRPARSRGRPSARAWRDQGLGASAGAAQCAEGDRVAAGLGGEVAAEAEHPPPLAEQRVAGDVCRGVGAAGPGRGRWPGVGDGGWWWRRRSRWRTWWRTSPGSRRPARGSAVRSGSSVRRRGRTSRTSSCRPNARTPWRRRRASTPGTFNRTEAAASRTRSARRWASTRAGCGREAVGRLRGRRGGSGRGSGPRRAAGTQRPWRTAPSRPHPEPAGRHRECLREQPAQGDGEASPQVRCPPLPHHVRGVVVAVLAQRLTQQRVVRRRAGRSRSAPGRAGSGPGLQRGDGSGRRARVARARARTTAR